MERAAMDPKLAVNRERIPASDPVRSPPLVRDCSVTHPLEGCVVLGTSKLGDHRITSIFPKMIRSCQCCTYLILQTWRAFVNYTAIKSLYHQKFSGHSESPLQELETVL
jgi:hypothetical protein